MALINCSECGKEYSDKAPACPNCGCPTAPGGMSPVSAPPETKDAKPEKPKKKKKGCLVGCLGSLGIFTLLALIASIFISIEENKGIDACNEGVAEKCKELLEDATKSSSYILDTSKITNKAFKAKFDTKKKELNKPSASEVLTGIMLNCQQSLKASLTDPDSLKIINRDFNSLRIEYSATNAFGRRIRNVVDCRTGKLLR